MKYSKKFKKFYEKYLQRIVWIIEDIPKNIYYHIINFPRRFKRALSWFFFMYMNEEWDQYYLLAVIEKKMIEMKRMWEDKSRIMVIDKTRKEILKEIKTALKHLKAFKDDDYLECKEYDALEKKWGGLCWEKDEEDPRLFSLERKKVKTKKQREQESKDFKKVYDLIDKRKQKDIDEFFRIFKENFQGWWD